ILKYLGLPYAEPPIGSLRFKAPQPKRRVDGSIQATQLSPGCMQQETSSTSLFADAIRQTSYSEDCLYLNLFVPETRLPIGKWTRNLAVMVYIHGGEFVTGSASWRHLDGSILAVHGGVIVVTLNYRLGVYVGSLGFLSTEDEESAGNYGLWDLITALRWLKINIKSFGGDTDRITVVGSTTTISMLLESSYTQGLFSKVIAQGGGPSPLFLFDKRAREKTQILAKNMDCESDSIKATIRCMGDVDARNFV
ncbi:hypothetical protein CAPTEDRAFT_85430, partial [Capitella teleta]